MFVFGGKCSRWRLKTGIKAKKKDRPRDNFWSESPTVVTCAVTCSTCHPCTTLFFLFYSLFSPRYLFQHLLRAGAPAGQWLMADGQSATWKFQSRQHGVCYLALRAFSCYCLRTKIRKDERHTQIAVLSCFAMPSMPCP